MCPRPRCTSPFITAFSSDVSGSGLLLSGRLETMAIQQGDNRTNLQVSCLKFMLSLAPS